MAFSSNTKNMAAERQKFRCGLCGTKNWRDAQFEYHHVMSHWASNDDALENCVMLCHDCHRQEAHVYGNTKGYVLDRNEYKYFNG